MKGSRSTWKNVMQVQGEHANSTQKGYNDILIGILTAVKVPSANHHTTMPPQFKSYMKKKKV